MVLSLHTRTRFAGAFGVSLRETPRPLRGADSDVFLSPRRLRGKDSALFLNPNVLSRFDPID